MRLLDRCFVDQLVTRQVDLMNGDDDRFEMRRDAQEQKVDLVDKCDTDASNRIGSP